jgi:hypothetical protein
MAATDIRTGEYGGSTSTVDSGTTNALARQPTTFDYSQSNQFRIYLPIFPTAEWFVVRANIPGVTLGQAIQPTPFSDISIAGDKIQYSDFSMTFIVDEKLQNYIEMYNWVKNIGFPFSRSEFNKLPRPDNINRASKTKPVLTSTGEAKVPVSDKNLYTDIRLSILSSKNNPLVNVTIYEAFPISLSSIEYNQQESDTDYATCEVSFAYTWFDVEGV